MSVLQKIAYYQNRRDEAPNQELARELAKTRDVQGIQEIAENLWNENKNVQSDCLKVLYEIGYIEPELIAGYASDFLRLLKSKNNRMVWGAMIGLATIASLRADEISTQVNEVMAVVERGSVITVVWGVKTLTAVAAARPQARAKVTPFLMNILNTCLPRDVALHAESSLPVIDPSNRDQFLSILERRQGEMKPSQQRRLKKVIKQVRSND